MTARAVAFLLAGPCGGDLVEIGLPAPEQVHVLLIDPAEWLGPVPRPVPRLAVYELDERVGVVGPPGGREAAYAYRYVAGYQPAAKPG